MKILETIFKFFAAKQVYTPIISICLGVLACRGVNNALKNSYSWKT